MIKLEKRNVIIDYSLLSIQFWATDFEYKNWTCLIIELFNFELSSPPTQKIMPSNYEPKSNTSCAPQPSSSLKKLNTHPKLLLPKRSFIKIESKKFNKESKQSKKQNKKVCNLYPFSWRNLCFKFFWVIFCWEWMLWEKTKTKQPYHVVCKKPKIPILLMETSMDLFWDMDHYELLFLSSMISFYSFTFKDKNLYSIFRYILYVCE